MIDEAILGRIFEREEIKRARNASIFHDSKNKAIIMK